MKTARNPRHSYSNTVLQGELGCQFSNWGWIFYRKIPYRKRMSGIRMHCEEGIEARSRTENVAARGGREQTQKPEPSTRCSWVETPHLNLEWSPLKKSKGLQTLGKPPTKYSDISMNSQEKFSSLLYKWDSTRSLPHLISKGRSLSHLSSCPPQLHYLHRATINLPTH